MLADGVSYLQLQGPAAVSAADAAAGAGSSTLPLPAGAPQLKKRGKTRPYTSWNDEEAALFFEGIKVFGRDHQKLANHITTKTYEQVQSTTTTTSIVINIVHHIDQQVVLSIGSSAQVRHFYYRLVKKMNVLLEPLGKRLNKTDKNEVRDAILFWYEFFKPKGRLTAAPLPGSEDANKLAPALAEFLKSRSSAASTALNLPAPSQQQHSHHPKTLLPKSQTDRLHSIIFEINSQQQQQQQHHHHHHQHLHLSLLPHPPSVAAATAGIYAETTTTARPSSPAPTPLPSSSSPSQGASATCGVGGRGDRNPATMTVNPRHQLTTDETKERRGAYPNVTAATTATRSTETANAQAATTSEGKASTTCVPPVTSRSSGNTTKGGEPRCSRNQREHSSVPKRITLQLIPKETTVAEQITRAGYNPLLQLTFAAKKPISYIIHHMMKKWVHDAKGQKVCGVQSAICWANFFFVH